MRSLVFGMVFLALATVGCSSFISTALSATRDAKSAEWFALDTKRCHLHFAPPITPFGRAAQRDLTDTSLKY